MTVLDLSTPSAATGAASRARALPASPAVIATIVCIALAVALTADRIADVWTTGAFFDSDDATRAVQVRTWLAGQDWYDLAIQRMGPAGTFMHWSRIVDLPLAGLIAVGERFTDPVHAERLARLLFPAGLFVGLLLTIGSAATILGGPRAKIAGIVLCFLGAPFLGQFIPGRIDHHAPQILLLALMTCATLRAFDPARAWHGAGAGLCAALSLAISLENLPFIAIVAASYPLLLAARGQEARAACLWFAGGFAVSLVLFFLTTVGPAHRVDPVCDAFSPAYLAPALAGCIALAVLAWIAPRVGRTITRATLLLPAAAAVFAASRFVAPNCLGDPFVGLDPLVRDIWLRHVGEVEPLWSFFVTHTWSAVALTVPMIAAAGLAILDAVRGQNLTRARHALLAALPLASVATSFWGIRALSSGLPLVALVAAPFVVRIADRFASSPTTRVALLAAVGLPFAPLPLAFALPADTASADRDTLSCLTPAALAPLTALPSGTVLAPIDAGGHVLALTPHRVLAAPYHRNNLGNRVGLDAWLARPDEARKLVQASGADYVATCAADGQAQIVAARAPDGLAAELAAGRVPAWLEPVAMASPMRVYRVTR